MKIFLPFFVLQIFFNNFHSIYQFDLYINNTALAVLIFAFLCYNL